MTAQIAHSRRGGTRLLDTAEGVLVGVRRCGLYEAFVDIIMTAKRHNVAPMSLAAALVAIAANDVTDRLDPDVLAAAKAAWGPLLSSGIYSRAPQSTSRHRSPS